MLKPAGQVEHTPKLTMNFFVLRRRPTASARRQREAAPVAELTEDVPALGAEGLIGDGAEGLVVMVLRDPLLMMLSDFQERPELKLVSHGRKVEKFGRPAPEIEGLVDPTRLTPLIECSVVTGDLGVIFAFVERWHKETSSFYLLVGELTITLDDVASLLHLPITGTFHSFEPLHVDEAVIMLVELLDVSGEEARAETSESYAWGAAALVHMYDQSNEASQSTRQQIVGYLTLLQCWIYEHFPSVHDSVTDDGYDETSPHA
ncbi:protein MAIN-LIKE 2-like [Glycine soja]|uniref:protein MAIN-LIKE 2-like n=1 Tax=Glycine soja TaxID=3848 RepID=UPI00103E00AF|nr:protein MAIN-LIKE 2-like [Glycine soja]